MRNMDLINCIGYCVLVLLHVVLHASSQDIQLCSDNEISDVSSGILSYSGSADLCVCYIENPAATVTTVVDLSLTMSLAEVNSPSGCFPRLGFRENVEATPFYVCPHAGEEGTEPPMRHGTVRLVGDGRSYLQVSNKDLEDFITEVEFSTVPATMLTISCTVNNQQDSWGAREDDVNFGARKVPDSPRNDPTVIGVSIAVAVVVVAVIAVILIIFLMKRRGRVSKNEKEMEKKEDVVDAENPAFHPDNDPPTQHHAPAQYGNVVNINPNPNPNSNPKSNNNPMSKQDSVGNLSVVSSVSSIGVPDLGGGAIHAAGARPSPPPQAQPTGMAFRPPPQLQQPPPPQNTPPPLQHVPYPQEPVHTQI